MTPDQPNNLPISDHASSWAKCLEFFRDNLPEDQYRVWFAPISFSNFDNGNLTLNVPSPYFVEHLEGIYIKLLGAAIKKNFGKDTHLYYRFYQVADSADTAVTMQSEKPSPAVRPKAQPYANPFQCSVPADIDSRLNPIYTFENYCSSDSNMVARSIAEAIADNENCKTFNPFFVFGPTGVGKTHLIQAIGIRAKELRPQTRVLYITARIFESQFTTASTTGKVNDFINFYQSIDILIIDDIQDLIGNKPATQNAFFHIFNHLHQNQKQLIMSSDVRPSLMEGMESRMLSRFKWGATAELSKPDYALRRKVLEQKASQDGISLSEDVVEYIAQNATDSVRELEGIVASMLAYATFCNRELTIDLARTVLANSVRATKRIINFESIITTVAHHYDIEPAALMTLSRKREISDARQMVMFLAKKHANMALTTIGKRLGRTHATVLHGCIAIEERLGCDKKLSQDLAKIEAELS